MDFFFDRVLVNLLRFLFLAIVLAPGLAAMGVWAFSDPVGVPPIFALLGQIDSGFQLGENSFLFRFALLALGGVAVLLGLPVPPQGRWMWRCSWLFIALAACSAYLSSHPFEALLTVADTALLNLIVLVAFHLRPRWSVGAASSLAALLVALASLDRFFSVELYANDDGRLNGTFFQPNVTAAFLAAALPWVLNQYVGARGRPRLQLLGLLAMVPIYLAFVLTGTRAAMLVGLLVLAGRWWLGGSLRRGHSLGVALLGSLVTCGVVLACCWLAISNSWALLALLLLLSVLAYRSGLPIWGVAVLCLLCLGSYQAQLDVAKKKDNAFNGITKRSADLQKGSDSSLTSRKEFWRAAILMGVHRPWLGVGPRGFHRYYPGYQSDVRWFSKFCHSACLSCFAELGFPGTLLVVVLGAQWLGAVGGKLRGERRPDPAPPVDPNPPLLDAATSAVILALCMAVDVQWLFPSLPALWATWLGVSLAYCWPEVPPPAAPPADEEISPWTLRPQVILTYFMLATLGIGAAFDMAFGMAQAHSERAESLMRRSEVALALQEDKISIELNPFQGAYYHHYGLAYSAALALKLEKKTPAEFLRIAERAVSLDSHRAVHWDLLHKALVSNKQTEKAQFALQKALECDPVNYPSFYVNLAELQTAPEQRSQRERILLACAQRFPADSLGVMFDFRSNDIVRQLSEVYMLLADGTDRNHPELALSYYDQILKLNPDEPNARLGRIVSLVNLNRLPEAHREVLALYKKMPVEEVVDAIKHIFALEHLPFDAKAYPVAKAQPKRP
ncbi:MAG: O-antigen ligase family protein [Candidatus Eremiobacteraeota bacterium]|nr:O-antigen ligase family protein [Candidatus Eremiobacteraeota bacterium]